MLLDEDPRRQRLHGVVVEHRNSGLHHDRSTVQLGCDEMHGRAADPHAVVERLALRVEAGKRRQQRRMNVEHALRKRRAASAGPTSRMKPARQTRSTSRALQDVGHRAIVGVAVGVVARAETHRLDARLAGAREPGRA